MKRLLSKVIALILFANSAVLNAQNGTGGQLHNNAFPLLQRLNAEVAARQNTDKKSPDYGGIICPGENLYHTRAGEAVWPFTFEYAKTGNKQRLKQAIILADWLFRQQFPEGYWKETPEEWTGTSTDQLLMLLLSYPILKPHLTKEQDKTWLKGMEKAADYLTSVMSNRFASINYCATTTATLAEAYLRFGKEEYKLKAESLAHMVVAKMNWEWFIEGEGTKEGAYKYGVDLGYNLEMSLWGLARYALRLNDNEVLDAVRKATANHFYFIYPDGMLDASAGIRSNKWTVFGSGTSDGCHPLFAQMSEDNPAYITAVVRNIHKIEECFSSCGLLGHGPSHDLVMSEAPCIYPTFTKAKSMAMAMDWVRADVYGELPPLPCDSDMSKYFPSVGMNIVREGDFCTTVSAYNYVSPEGPKCKYMHRPTGGAMSALWVDGYGLFQAASQTEYHRWEPMSFPEMGDIKPLTPRIELTDANGFHTNLYEFDSPFVVDADHKTCEASGHLKDRNGKRCGVSYRVTYSYAPKCLTKKYEIKFQTTQEPVLIVEPAIMLEGTEFRQIDSKSVSFTRNGKEVLVHLQSNDYELTVDTKNANSYKQVYPSLIAMPLVVRVTHNGKLQAHEIKIEFISL